MKSLLKYKWGRDEHSEPLADCESAVQYHYFLTGSHWHTLLAMFSVFQISHDLAEMLLSGSSFHIFQKPGEIKPKTKTIKQTY